MLCLGPMFYSSWAFNYSLSHKLLTNFTNKLKKVVGWWVSPGLLCFSPSLVAYLHILCGANKICNFLTLSLLCSPLGIDCWCSGLTIMGCWDLWACLFCHQYMWWQSRHVYKPSSRPWRKYQWIAQCLKEKPCKPTCITVLTICITVVYNFTGIP